jgi:hypothetical protein
MVELEQKNKDFELNLAQQKKWKLNFITRFDIRILKNCQKYLSGRYKDELLCNILTEFVSLIREQDLELNQVEVN